MSSTPRKKPGRPKKPPITESEIQGRKFLHRVFDLLRPLHDHKACPNRDLHYDELVAYLLLYFFTPVLTSMRGLQQVSNFKILKKKLGLHRFSLGSFSESSRIFDPSLLEPIINELASGVNAVDGYHKLPAKDLALCAVDGSLLHALPKMAWALWLDDEHHAAKMHLEFDVIKGVPTQATLTNGNGNERTELREMLLPRKLYVLDRGYAEYDLMDEIIRAGSSFVVRIKNNAVYEVITELPISDPAREKGIVRDCIVHLGTPNHSALRERPVRVLEIHVEGDSARKHNNRVSSKTKAFRSTKSDYTLVLATDLLDLDAELVAEIFRSRWQVELFFRWFKKILQADRLLCLSQNGMTIVMYCALIASLLVVLWTGRKPNKRSYELLCFHMMGWIGHEELVRHLDALPPAVN